MQWIFMVVGLLVGGVAGESLTGALLGGVCGLALGQALRLQMLAADNQRLQQELKGFAERFERGTQAIHARLVKVEQQAAPEAFTPPAAAPAPEPEPELAPESADFSTLAASAELAEAAMPAAASDDRDLDSELVWELPSDLPSPAVAAATVAQPSAPQFEAVPVAPPVRPQTPPPPAPPGLIEQTIGAVRNWLFGGNPVLRIGAVLLFLGLAFLLRYATEGMVVPVELRYAGVAAAAVGLLGLGWWLRHRRESYALILQGTGIAVLYLTVFAAMRLHPLIDPKAALALLVLVTLFSAILAVSQNALGLAAAAALGGFAAPILTSTGSGNHVALFSYFILLNSGILAIAWFKAWRLLNLIGFLGTFGIGFAWGLRSYKPELLASTEPFLVVFFLMYVAIGLLFARRTLRDADDAPQAAERGEWLRWAVGKGDYVDATALFGPPLVGFSLQFALVRHLEFGAAFSALALGLFYLLLARLLAGRVGQRAQLLVETCLALGVVFGSLAIPLGLDARWTSAAWAVEGAGIFWMALRQQRRLARGFALLLQFGAGVAFLLDLQRGGDTLLAGAPLGAAMLAVALLFSFWQLRQHRDLVSDGEARLLPWLAVSGLAFAYLIAPLCFDVAGTAISWAVAGLLTLLAGLRLQSRSFLFSAFAVQLLGGALFLVDMDGSQLGSGLGASWRSLLAASLIGLLLIGGMLLAGRHSMVREDRRLLRGLTLVLLLGLVFINLAVLFVLPWLSASGVWAATGLLIVWLSLHLQQRASFIFGLLLQLLGGLTFFAVSPLLLGQLSGEGLTPLAHAGFWTPMALALAALFGSWRLRLAEQGDGLGALNLQRLAQLLLVWGAAWWALTLASEVLRFVDAPLQSAALLLVAAASVLLATLLAVRLHWVTLALLGSLLMPVSGVILLWAWHSQYHPLANLGWLAWAAVFAVHALSLRRLATLLPAGPQSAAHVLGLWLLLGVLALELRYLLMLLAEAYNAWRWLGWSVLPSLWLLLVCRVPRLPWPVAAFPREYRLWASLPLALLMLLWFWLANAFSAGDAAPLPYVPLLNPLEIGLLLALLGAGLWLREGLPELGVEAERSRQVVAVAVGASLFALATAMVFRTAFHWAGVPYQLSLQLDSMLVQAGLSIVWTLIALALMIVGHLRVRRELWVVGALLIAVVVAKLFFVELGNRGGLERIISFIGVGVLLLVVGYFAPLPPRQDEAREEQAREELK